MAAKKLKKEKDCDNRSFKIRILQHDIIDDEISISAENTVTNLEELEKDVIQEYEEACKWHGGFESACKTYYKRIAIVHADTLEEIKIIYQK